MTPSTTALGSQMPFEYLENSSLSVVVCLSPAANPHLLRPVFWGHVRQAALVSFLPLAPLRLAHVRQRLPVVERARLRRDAALCDAASF